MLLVRKERDRLLLPGGTVNSRKELVAANPKKVVAMVDTARCRVLIYGIVCDVCCVCVDEYVKPV